ncbi:MAG: DEAD/DEAH box helicase [Lentisphaeria bacterium]
MGQKAKELVSWETSDTQEIERRRTRALEEEMQVKVAEKGVRSLFQDYLVSRTGIPNPLTYHVELRSLSKFTNTCTCPDFQKNFLGTCKHIEKVLATIKRGKTTESPYVELFMSVETGNPSIALPKDINSQTATFIDKFLDAEEKLRQPRWNTLQVFLRDMEQLSPEIRKEIRVSSGIYDYQSLMLEKDRLEQVRNKFASKLREDAGQTNFLRHPLYDYQIDGMLHLAFSGRAMLADEMGLGKTVQAIAAAAVMREYFGVSRVLVVSPASLKTEWEEQIRKFTALPVEIIYGSRKARLETYRKSTAFFILTNYEQIIRDYDEINSELMPDIVILDEAQRIKNWRTMTANHLKRLQSRFAFVLTGTPIENKIDELYSLVEFINPAIFGSLFRFNRRFYHFGEDGKVDGVRNLRELHEEVGQIMLRRRKTDISEQLPERIDNNYFVEMSKEQRTRYTEYETIVARLYQMAKKRPLLPQEFERLQIALGCMRNLCDSVYIMDPKIKEAPKVDELMRILEDIWAAEPERKVLIFSEWVRMLELVEERLNKQKICCALHVGHVPQQKRRKEINRFKEDPACRVFLSSDSGGVGLNLQAASVVVNLDLPWNPARLEQRIARAWRKHQKNSVNVINLISRNTIEHKMLATLEFKQGLADVVLDAIGEFEEFEKVNAKAAFMERLSKIMECDPPATPAPMIEDRTTPVERLTQELTLDNPGIGSCSILYDPESGTPKSVFAVGSANAAEKLQINLEKTHGARVPDDRIALVAPEQYALLQKLAALGIITINDQRMTGVFQTETLQPPSLPDNKLRMKKSRAVMNAAERKLKMAQVLKSGEFLEEALQPAKQAVLSAALALFVLAATETLDAVPEEFTAEMMPALKKGNAALSREQLMFLQLVLHDLNEDNTEFLKNAEDFIEIAAEYLNKQSLTS